MTKLLSLEEHLPSTMLEFTDEDAIAWYNNSELASDSRTAQVVKCLEPIDAHRSLADDAMTALWAGLYHRATQICTGPDGKPIENVEDIPAPLGEIEYAILRGYRSKSALDEFCTVTEEIAPAAMINMATRWAEGKKAYKWTLEAIDKAYRPLDEPSHHTTQQRIILERFQSRYVDD